ncbi:Dienelactone hydrolase [Microlunatus sagamiharensis]|uniref:Dienelactone hydrolase n=1 Tax=Microlunatus sagamiharensis TaxID=546874 RepID=A0A1H2N405_9ACTN|nr:dienelactone hydrolase family protein [Microlunatus sagamiharensis]SDV00217.1 Dienelactone hydrolase [Microlunatus sagamiharensis]
MAEVLLFHHVLGRTAGMEALAERFREAGHTVHLPDLFEGRTFTDRGTARAYVDEVGFDTLVERGRVVAEDLPRELVYAGISLGALPAQLLTQTRLGARAAVLISAAGAPSDFDAPWPRGVPVQVHLKEDDPLMDEGDLAAARSIVEVVPDAELFRYPGATHLFTEAGYADHDPAATDLLVERVTALLGRV